jgi:hypothetical protein
MIRSNIETVARAWSARICRHSLVPEAAVAAWVDRYWECVAAELEAGLINDQGIRLVAWTPAIGLHALRDWERRHPER